LKIKAVVNSTKWYVSSTYLLFGINFFTQILLLRILSSENFGEYALILAVTDYLLVLSALITNKAFLVYQNEENSYGVALLIAWALYVLLLIVSYIVVGFVFNGDDRIYGYFMFFFPIKLLSIPLSIYIAHYEKKLLYKFIGKMQLFLGFSANIIVVFFAYLGIGTISLLLKDITIVLGGFIFMQKYKPDEKIHFNRQLVKKYLSYGMGLMNVRLFATTLLRAPVLFITYFFGTSVAGLYDRAYWLVTLTNKLISPITHKVGFSILTKLNNDKKLKLARVAARTISILLFPIFIIFVFYYDVVAQLVFGDKWGGIDNYIQSLSVVSLAIPIWSGVIFQYYLSKKETLKVNYMQICMTILLGIGVFLSWNYDNAMIISIFVSSAYLLSISYGFFRVFYKNKLQLMLDEFKIFIVFIVFLFFSNLIFIDTLYTHNEFYKVIAFIFLSYMFIYAYFYKKNLFSL
jgi:O-antigen/teichoic acid export membrane protein